MVIDFNSFFFLNFFAEFRTTKLKNKIMNTTENNKIIASFLGQNKIPYEFPKFGYIKMDGDYSDTFFDNQLKFHKDWNWLMEVVEKIETFGADLTIRAEHTIIVYDEGEEISTFCFKDKKEAVYNACVEFIKWYNFVS
jgi:hypothetical protein